VQEDGHTGKHPSNSSRSFEGKRRDEKEREKAGNTGWHDG
jgi:hypothetical protein